MGGTKGHSGGHNKKTREQHILAGTFRKGRHGNLVDIKPPANPKGAIDNPLPVQVPKPAYLTVQAAVVWDALAPGCTMMGTLTPTDARAFSVLCELVATQDAICTLKNAPGFQPILSGGRPDPVFRMERDGAAALRPWYEMFGLTSGARQRLHVQAPSEQQKPQGKLEKFRPSRWAGVLP